MQYHIYHMHHMPYRIWHICHMRQMQYCIYRIEIITCPFSTHLYPSVAIITWCNILCDVAFVICVECNIAFVTSIACNIAFVASIAFMRVAIKTLKNLTVWKQSVNFSGGAENKADVFLHNICKRIFCQHWFLFLHRKEMRSRTHLQQPDVFLPW